MTSDKSLSALSAAVTIYGHEGSRSPLVNWACLELGVDFCMGDLSCNPHPFQQLPCLTDGDALVFESGAILQYLVQSKAANKLATAEQAAVLSWIVWANASLDPVCFINNARGQVIDTGLNYPERHKRIDRLNAILQENKGVLVKSLGFSVADVAVASYLLYTLLFFPNTNLTKWPAIVEYLKMCVKRPAYVEAFGPAMASRLLQGLEKQKVKR
jgi:glutathione S-transferase